jgi:protein-L-isoaspartate(D-aspartate) O-methyltransferase
LLSAILSTVFYFLFLLMSNQDTYKHQGLRKGLINTLKGKGVDSKAILDAIMKVPRHFFMDSAFLKFAYDDSAFPIGAGQTISQPYTVAIQSNLLDVKWGTRVLEVGTGSGYQAAVLAAMGCKVFTIERQKSLFKKARKMLDELNTTAKVFYGDGYKGLPAFAPFERILVTCGAPDIPESLLPQLKPGGIMVVPVGEGESQVMTRVIKDTDGTITKTTHGAFKFVPMLHDKQSQ